MRYYELTQEARAEIGQVIALSLLRSAEQEIARTRRPGFRRRRAQRRVRELQQLLDAAAGGQEARSGWRVLLRLLSALWILEFAAGACYVAFRGITTVTGVADVLMLALTVGWLCAFWRALPPTPDADARSEEVTRDAAPGEDV